MINIRPTLLYRVAPKVPNYLRIVLKPANEITFLHKLQYQSSTIIWPAI